MADSYISTQGAADLNVPVKAAAVYAAHESSLFLGGQLIPVVMAPTGLVRVPKLTSSIVAQSLAAGAFGDLTHADPTDTSVDIVADLIAARSVVRDLGSVDPAEIGRALGNAVSAKFDTSAVAAMAGFTAQEMTGTGNNVALSDVFTAVSTIRGNGETGQLFGIVSPEAYAELMTAIGSTSYAGGDLFQGQALRSGYLGSIAGVQMFVSSYFTAANVATGAKMAIFGADAMRIAMQANVNVEVGRRPEAVGYDVVASLHAKAALVDAARGVLVKDAA